MRAPDLEVWSTVHFFNHQLAGKVAPFGARAGMVRGAGFEPSQILKNKGEIKA
jgi:hypothetical protein